MLSTFLLLNSNMMSPASIPALSAGPPVEALDTKAPS
jgi:hypothetical protein